MAIDKKMIDRAGIITRKQIAILAGVSLAKITLSTRVLAWEFPKPIIRLRHQEMGYDKNEILCWLKKNDLKKMHLPAKKIIDAQQQAAAPGLCTAMAIAFLTGKFDRNRKTCEKSTKPRKDNLC